MRNLNPIQFFTIILLFVAYPSFAQLDSCNVFIKGNYIEVGVAPSGAFGSTSDAPVTYVTRPVYGGTTQTFYNVCDKSCIGRKSVGFIADPDKDGYLFGSPAYYGDYFVPGTPQEGWAVSMNGTEVQAYNYLSGGGSCGSGFSATTLTGKNTGYLNLGKYVTGFWAGEFDKSSTEKLAITQTTSVDTSTVYFVVYVTLKNVGTATLSSIYYMRTVDPDNDVTISGDYTTRNVVSWKIPNPANKVAVSSWGTHYTRAFCGLGTEDCRAKAFIVNSGLIPTNSIASIYGQTASNARYDSLISDVGIGLAYSLGSLASGDSTAIAYAYVLNIDELDSAFAATRPKWANSGDSATFKGGDTSHVCRNTVSTINIVNGGAYTWTWSVFPTSTPISSTTGPTVNVTVGTSDVYIRAIGTSPACFTDTIYMSLKPDKVPSTPPSKTYVYCQGDIPAKLSATGTNLLWYTTDTGGVGTSAAPTPSTSTAGTYYWWVSQTIKGCESDRGKMTVIVNPGTTDSFSYHITYGCQSDQVEFTDRTTGGIVSSYVWDFGDGGSDTVKNPIHVYAKQGTYKVKMITLNNFNCQYSYSTSITISHPMTATVSITPDTTCEFKPITYTGTATGKAPLSYFWDFGDGGTATTATTNHSYGQVGVFKVMFIATDSIGCHDTAITYASIDTFAAINFTASDDFICVGKTVKYIGEHSPIGYIGNIWDFADGSILKNQDIASHAFDRPGTYTVTLTGKYRRCPDTIMHKDVVVHGLPVIYLGPDTSMCPNGPSLTLSDNVNAGNPGATWTWNTGATGSSIQVTQYGLYYVTVTVDGCTNRDSVNVKNDCYINLPNAFTPNGDGNGDYFFPRQLLSSGVTEFKMEIFDRWGQLIFETTNINGRGWDGTFNDVKQPTGVYVYVIDVTIKNGVKQHYQGNVSLLR